MSQIFLPTARAQAPEPLEKARGALAQGKLDDAERWLDLTLADFQKHPLANEALAQAAALAAAKELTFAKLLTLWKDGSRLERIENGDSKMNLDIAYYEDEARSAAQRTLALARKACGPQPAWVATLHAPKLDDDVEPLRSRVKKGEWLGPQDRKRLETAEWKLNYAGILRDALPTFTETDEDLRLEGPFAWENLFFALGTRLTLAQKVDPKPALAQGARACLRATLDRTKDRPYSDLHQQAKQALLALDSKR